MGELGNLANKPYQVGDPNDHIVIKDYISGYDGGRTLDTEGYSLPYIKAGHVVIKNAEGNFKPMPISGETYAALPEGFEYAGVVVGTVPTKRPFVGVLTRGTVNHKAAPFTMDAIIEDVKKACPHIEFRAD